MIRAVASLPAQQDSAPPRVRTVRVALAGCGVVGGAFVQLLQSQADRFLEERRLRFQLTRVLVRHPERVRPIELQRDLYTADLNDFLAADADIVVELVGGINPAYQIVSDALQRGARVVTANKALLAAVGPELALDAQRAGATLDFEASVAGGIPIIRTLRNAVAGQPVRRISGILNGTTNYILNAMSGGASLNEALRQAQRLGFAEADATRDLNGTDAREKLAVLAWLAWGIAPNALNVRQRGIDADTARHIEAAAAVGGTLRLLAECERIGNRLSASIEPVIVDRYSDAGRTAAENNFVRVEFDESPPLQLSGPGAGGLPTACAVLSDVLQACTPLPRSKFLLSSQPDAEKRKWVLSASANGAGLCAHLRTLGIAAQPLESGRPVAHITAGPCSWPQLTAALQTLNGAGRSIGVSRLEMDV